MKSSRNEDRHEGRLVGLSGLGSAAPRLSWAGSRWALVGVTAAASVIAAGCTPLTAAGGGRSAGVRQLATTGQSTYRPVADAYVSSNALDSNTGTNTKLVASGVAGAVKTSYLKFSVSGIPAGSATSAHLVLHRTDHHLPSTLKVSTASSNWAEMGITGRNAPAVGAAVALVHPASAPTSLSVNVSAAVKGNGTVTFAITDPTAVVADFYSRESGNTSPSLVVSYKHAAALVARAPVPAPAPKPASSSGCTVSALLVPSCGVWWGIGPNPLGSESWDQALTNFENQQGRLSDLLHYYHVGTTLFPTANEINRTQEMGETRLLMENWKPELGHSWAQVAAGVPAVDTEIDNEAGYLKSHFTSQFFLSIHHEPENEVIQTAGSGFTAADYAAMYRHVVLRLKADGVTNAVFVMDYMGYSKWGEQPWFSALYPGDNVVDWIGYDPYSNGNGTFASLVNGKDGAAWPGMYTWATTNHPGKPLMLAEWGVTESGNANGKANFFNTMPAYEQSFPAIKALIYWNDGALPTRIDSSPQSLAAFQQVAKNPLYNPTLP